VPAAGTAAQTSSALLALLGLPPMPTVPQEPLSQRLAAIREQLKLLSDYL
jgi:hypothetical protein